MQRAERPVSTYGRLGSEPIVNGDVKAVTMFATSSDGLSIDIML